MERDINRLLLLILFLIVLGTGGYLGIEGWSIPDALYMTVITLSTVGFGEVRPLSPTGKMFTSVLILLGVGSLAYVATRATEAILQRGVLRKRRLAMEIKRLKDHVIVCGFGRMGLSVVEQLHAGGAPCVVIEKDPAATADLERRGLPYVLGDATDDSTMIEAGIGRARSMATVLPHDADNLFVTLTARKLNESLTIISRSSSQKNDTKMLTAGATRVLNPYLNGGRLMARQLLHPSVTEFIDTISRWQGEDLGLEEVVISADSPLASVNLRDAPIRPDIDVIVVGVRTSGAGMRFNPAPDLVLESGDTLVVLGRRENLRRLALLAEGQT